MRNNGTVKQTYENTTKNGKSIYSFQLEGDKAYYRCGFTKPTFGPGSIIRFEYETDSYGNQVDMKTLEVKPGGPEVIEPSKMSKGGNSSFGRKDEAKDKYWADKEAYDKQVKDPIIQYQNATGIATNLVCAALAKDILPLPAKKGDQFDAVLAMVNEVRNKLYQDYREKMESLAGSPSPTPFPKKEETKPEVNDNEEEQEENDDNW